MIRKTLLLTVPTLLFAAGNLAFGQFSIGLNFGADEGNTTGQQTALGAGDVAGVVGQANWNNLNGASGSASGLLANNGAATSASVTWTSPNTWSSTGRGSEDNNGFPAGGDRTLLMGYLDSGADAAGGVNLTVTGLGSEFTSLGYDVYVYILGGVPGRGGGYTIGSATRIGTTPAFPTAHAEDLGVDMTDTGTYVKFSGLTGDSFTLTSDASLGNFRAPIGGLQIVAVPEPSLAAFATLGGAGLLVLFRRRR